MWDDALAAFRRLRIAPGDEATWRKLVHWLWPYAIAVAQHSFGRRHALLDAEQAVQDALMDLAQTLLHLHLETPEALRGLVATLVRNRVVDQYRYLESQGRDIRRERVLPAEELAQIPLSSSTGPNLALDSQDELEVFLKLFAGDAV